MEVVYAPVFLYYLWLSVRARSFFFFSAANPGIETGGMLGERKSPIIRDIPEGLKPLTVFISPSETMEQVLAKITDAGIGYPLIAKPDVGERGFLVEKITDEAHLRRYVASNKVEMMVQEYIEFPVEVGVLYYRYPGEKKGRIYSVVLKEFLTVTGDGKRTVRQLMEASERAVLQLEKISQRLGSAMEYVPMDGEHMLLEPIGNHARGTKFLSGMHLIDEALTSVFDEITDHFTGYHFVRYDLRTTSMEDLRQGRNIRILEINGVGAEAAHVYDPAYSKRKAYRDFFHLWKVIYKIARTNHKAGVPYMTWRETQKRLRELKQYRKFATS